MYNEYMNKRKAHRIGVFFEFLVFGIIIGIAEDLIVVAFATGEPITWKIVGIVVLVAIPFAILGELIVDNIDFTKHIEKLSLKWGNKLS
jgi:hypothetical protein